MSYFSRPHPTTTETLLLAFCTISVAAGAVYFIAWLAGWV